MEADHDVFQNAYFFCQVAAMQKRLEAYEDLTQRKVEELTLRITSYCDTIKKTA